MNNIILIRDQKIAHVRGFGSYGALSRDIWDPLDLVTREGFFIPVSTHGAKALPYLNHSQKLMKLMRNEDIMPSDFMDAGILLHPEGYVCMVGVDTAKGIYVTPMTRRGTCIFSPVESLSDTMAACVSVTNTIEESVEMYRKHINFSKKNIVIKPLAEYAQFWNDNKPEPPPKRNALEDL